MNNNVGYVKTAISHCEQFLICLLRNDLKLLQPSLMKMITKIWKENLEFIRVLVDNISFTGAKSFVYLQQNKYHLDK